MHFTRKVSMALFHELHSFSNSFLSCILLGDRSQIFDAQRIVAVAKTNIRVSCFKAFVIELTTSPNILSFAKLCRSSPCSWAASGWRALWSFVDLVCIMIAQRAGPMLGPPGQKPERLMQRCYRLGCALVRQQLCLSARLSPVFSQVKIARLQQLDSGSGAFCSAQWVAQQKPKLSASLFYKQLSGMLRSTRHCCRVGWRRVPSSI